MWPSRIFRRPHESEPLGQAPAAGHQAAGTAGVETEEESMTRSEAAKELHKVERQIEKVTAILGKLQEREAELLRALGKSA